MQRLSNTRGQITIEALLIFGMFILVLVSISIPMVFEIKNAATDIEIISDARYAAEQVASAASGISSPDAKRTLDVYIPGYISAGSIGNNPFINITTRMSTNGDSLIAYVTIQRRKNDGTLSQNENYNFTKDLPGTGWRINGTVVEQYGGRYIVVVEWKNITFTRR